MNPIGPLTGADESFGHQITDTQVVVSTSDLAWTEKVCAMAAAKDGSIQIGFGLGRYTNRDVMDGYAGVSRGCEQLTVRASRRLSPNFDETSIGPIRYEIIEPLTAVRFSLEPNAVLPLAFDLRFDGVIPCQLEERTHQRNSPASRISADLVRYHQVGVPTGWLELDGVRTEIHSDSWIATRDHSWGVRYDVGQPIIDVEKIDPLEGLSFSMIWSPILFERSDGSRYAVFLHTVQVEGFGQTLHKTVTGAIEHEDGTVIPLVDIDLSGLRFDPNNRRLLGGVIVTRTTAGELRTFTLEVPTDTGFHLGAGLYFGWQGRHHGEFRGLLNVEGERIEDCREPEIARELHQIRDTFIVVDDPIGGGRGFGNCQPIVAGPFERWGLDAKTSFW